MKISDEIINSLSLNLRDKIKTIQEENIEGVSSYLYPLKLNN